VKDNRLVDALAVVVTPLCSTRVPGNVNYLPAKFENEMLRDNPNRPQIEVTFDIDANGKVLATAVEKFTGSEKQMSIQIRFSKEQFKRLDDDDGKKEMERGAAVNSLESYCFEIKERVEKAGTRISGT